MSLAKLAWSWSLVLVLLVLAAGCRGGPATMTSRNIADLREIHEMYDVYVKRHQKPPRQLSDLATKELEAISPAAFRALKQGKYVVIFNVTAQDSGTVLAYEKDAPTQGGSVLMADGTVREMTAELALKAALPGK